jgi:tetratricopeptide (TPR) repeat protein
MAARLLALCLAISCGIAAAPAQAEEPSPAIRAKAKARIKKARAAYEAGNYDQAVAEYTAAYKLLPLSDILFNLGQILRVKEDKPQALRAYRKYLEAEPNGSHAEDAKGYVATLTREVLPEALQPKYDAAKLEYEAFHDKNGDAFDARWLALGALIASGDPGVDTELESLRHDIRERSKPAPKIDEAVTARAVAKTTRTKPRETGPGKPLLKKWWFWTAVGGAAAVLITGIAVGAALGSSQSDPVPTLGVLK